jgi:hypothetical protein
VPPEELINQVGLFAINLLYDSAGCFEADSDGLLEITAGATDLCPSSGPVFDARSEVVLAYALGRTAITEFYTHDCQP